MKTENFIPNQIDVLDSDDSSIHGELITGMENHDDLLSDEDNSIDDSGSDFSDQIENSSGSDTDEGLEPKKQTSDETKSKEDDDKDNSDDDSSESDSDEESTSSEEIDASMQDIFENQPNHEANRNHPPNLKTDNPVLDLCFHPEAELLATASINGESTIYRYNMEKVEVAARFSHHEKSCRQICFNVDGSLLYTVSKDKSLAVVDTHNSAITLHYKDAHQSPIYSFYEVDEHVCATGDDDGVVKVWDLRKKEAVFEFKCGEQTVTSLLSCEPNKYLSATVADGSLTAINLRSRRMEAQSEMYDSEFTCQALVKDDTKLAVGSGSGTLFMFKWGSFGHNVDALKGHPDLVQCMAPITENIVITGCEDGNIRAIQLYNHKFLGIVGEHKDFGVENLAVSCDSCLLASCSMDEEIQFWNIEYLHRKGASNKKKGKKSVRAASRTLVSSKKRNPRDFFHDIPRVIETTEDDGPVPSTSYDSDSV